MQMDRYTTSSLRQAGEHEQTANGRTSLLANRKVAQPNESSPNGILAFQRTTTGDHNRAVHAQRRIDLPMTELERSHLHWTSMIRNEVSYRNALGGTGLNPHPSTAAIGPGLVPRGHQDDAMLMMSNDLHGSVIPILPETITGAPTYLPGSNTQGHLQALRERIAHEEIPALGMTLEERKGREEFKEFTMTNDLHDSAIELLPETGVTGASLSPPGFDTLGHLHALRRRIAQKEILIDMLLEERKRREKVKDFQAQEAIGMRTAYHHADENKADSSVKTQLELSRGFRPEPNDPRETTSGQLTIPVAVDVDKYVVSPYQQILRDSIEFFVLDRSSQVSLLHGRDYGLEKGQVGIRCRCCKGRDFRSRGRGSAYFPSKAAGVYQAAQNIGTNHLLSSCPDIPADRKEEMSKLRKTSRRRHGGGKRYWEECCQSLGLYDRMDKPGIWLKSPPR